MIDSAKWKKRLLLVFYGLTTIEELENETKRFASVFDVFNHIKIDGSVYIVKLVPREMKPGLKNYVIRDEKGKQFFAEDVAQYHNYCELWCCKNACSGEMPVYGRLVFDGISQTIEMICGETARLLEKIPSVSPYVIARRLSWGMHYTIQKEGDIPFQDVFLRVENKREQIEAFVADLQRIGIESISFEFRVYKSKIVIIDWDSADDRSVINKLGGRSI